MSAKVTSRSRWLLAGSRSVCHAPSSGGWLLLSEDAVVPGFLVLGIVLDLDRGFGGPLGGR